MVTVKKLSAALAVILVAVVVGNVFFWNTTYTNDVQNIYSFGYQQGIADEHMVAYQDGLVQGNLTGYQTGYDAGQNVGFANGNQSGYQLGYNDGESQGIVIGNDTGFVQGSSSGYESGYQVGEVDGYQLGNETGYSLGYSVGHQLGETTGFADGNATGYQVGYQAGYSNGSSEGYLQGLEDGAGTGYTERDPTYQEMISFIASDKTDLNQYVEGSYVCWNFAADLINNAFNAGYRCGFVYMEFVDSAHAIVCFDTIDNGLLFVEPQDDNIVSSLVIGQHYWDRSIYQVNYDDTILDYGIIW